MTISTPPTRMHGPSDKLTVILPILGTVAREDWMLHNVLLKPQRCTPWGKVSLRCTVSIPGIQLVPSLCLYSWLQESGSDITSTSEQIAILNFPPICHKIIFCSNNDRKEIWLANNFFYSPPCTIKLATI